MAWRTSRRFFSAAARAMARVLRAVSRRVPSSARSAESPSAWVLTFGFEDGGGMCAHKNGVEDARHEAGAQQANACNPYRPTRDYGRGGEVPGREVVFDCVDGASKVDVVPGVARVRETSSRVRHVQQQKQSPWQGEDQRGDDV